MDAHPNRRYFVLKSIILNNFYAVKICKLRLFLKLAAQVEPDAARDNLGIEPLPDIDFNIRAGNTLVGYATYDEVKRAITSGLDFDNAMEKSPSKPPTSNRPSINSASSRPKATAPCLLPTSRNSRIASRRWKMNSTTI